MHDGYGKPVKKNEERCEKSDLLKSQCAHCLNHTLEEEDEPITFEGLRKARR